MTNPPLRSLRGWLVVAGRMGHVERRVRDGVPLSRKTLVRPEGYGWNKLV